jgi:hypothetical protein
LQELKEIAESKGLEFKRNIKKAEIIELINSNN